MYVFIYIYMYTPDVAREVEELARAQLEELEELNKNIYIYIYDI